MSKSFREGHKYVFTKKKFIQSEGKKWYKFSKDRVDICNGRNVNVLNKEDGKALGFLISPKWCKCVGKED